MEKSPQAFEIARNGDEESQASTPMRRKVAAETSPAEKCAQAAVTIELAIMIARAETTGNQNNRVASTLGPRRAERERRLPHARLERRRVRPEGFREFGRIDPVRAVPGEAHLLEFAQEGRKEPGGAEESLGQGQESQPDAERIRRHPENFARRASRRARHVPGLAEGGIGRGEQ